MDQRQAPANAPPTRHLFWLYALTVSPLLVWLNLPGTRADNLLVWIATGIVLLAGLPWNLLLLALGAPLLDLLAPTLKGPVITMGPLLINAILLWTAVGDRPVTGFDALPPRLRLVLLGALILSTCLVTSGYALHLREYGQYQAWIRVSAGGALILALGSAYLVCVGRVPWLRT